MNKWLLTIMLFSLALNPSFAYQPLDEVYLTKIEATRDRGFDYLDIYTSADVKAKGILLEDQLIIELPNTKLAKDLEIIKRNLKRVKDFSVKQLADSAEITVNLKKNIDYDIVNVFGRGKSVVEISARLDYTTQLMAAWEKRNLKIKGQALKPRKFTPDVDSQDQSLKGKVIVIEPGHGGKDPGAFSVNHIPEKHLTLQTARRIAAFLNAYGATVYLTRNSDRTCNLKDIVAFTNKVKADAFISLHYNYMNRKKISGTETFYYNRSSRNFALAMHRSLIYGIKRKDRGLRRVMFYTVHHTKMPAVLIEPIYISNAEEAKLVASENFQHKIAKYAAKGVKTYFRSTAR
ncbi:N-acetylmuramoyl-L-alanine amidase [Candidatus Margulisiibacteriota bacterium]